MSINSKNIKNENLLLFLRDKGFSEEEIIKIITDNSFFQYDYNKIDLMGKNSYNYLIEKSFSPEIIKKMILRYPLIYGHTEKRILDRINYLVSLGYNKETAIFIIKKNPNIYGISIDALNNFVSNIKKIGFSNKDILRIGKNYPTFWNKSFNKINEVINVLITNEIGFSKEEIIKIIVNASSILGYEIDSIKKKIKTLVNLGFTEDEIRKMIVELPALIVSDIERTKRIIDFFTSIKLHDKIKLFPKSFFMQSVETSYAKYCFYKDRGILIDENNFKRLFYGFSFYKKTYGVDKKELLSKYDYNLLLENNKKKN